MGWKEFPVSKQREEFVLRSMGGSIPLAELCREYGISRKTGYKWLARFREEGPGGMVDASRRPKSCPQELGEDAVCWMVRWKRAHPNWGPKKFHALYGRLHPGSAAPSVSSIRRVLVKAGLVEKQRSCRRVVVERGAPFFAPVRGPNDLWTIDFKGWWRTVDARRCEPLTVRDAFSRFVLCAVPMTGTKGNGVRLELERVFACYGLPKAIRSDNGSPFACSLAPRGLSTLSAWLVSLGIRLERTLPARPDQNGGHERMHRDIAREVEGFAGTFDEQCAALELWREEFNTLRPHEALGMRMPAEVYRPSEHKFRGTPQALEYPKHFMKRRVGKSGRISLDRGKIFVSCALTGWDIGLLPEGDQKLGVWFGELYLGWVDESTESFHAASADAESAGTESSKSNNLESNVPARSCELPEVAEREATVASRTSLRKIASGEQSRKVSPMS